MRDAARVLAVDVLEELRLALLAFAEEGRHALDMAEGEIRRIETWVAEQLGVWHAEVRRREEEVFLAKQELTRRKMMGSRDHPVDTTDQEKALQTARSRLRYAEDKVEITRNWVRQLVHELEEYEGPARGLRSVLESDVPRASALLERKSASLDAYLNLGLPAQAGAGQPGPTPEPAPVAAAPKKADAKPAAGESVL